MNRNDRLYNDYEDALFALLMDEVAQEEGARLLEEDERLKNDPNAAVPPELDKKSLETIRRTLAGRRHRTHTVGWYLGRLAIAILAALLLFAVAYASIPDLRLRTLQMLIENSDVSSRLSFAVGGNANKQGTEERPQTLAGYKLPEISDDYSVVDQGETSRSAWIKYQHANGSIVRIRIGESADDYFDSEDADALEEIEVQGYSGVLIEKQDAVRISWFDDNGGKRIYLTTTGVDRKTALSYAEQIARIAE